MENSNEEIIDLTCIDYYLPCNSNYIPRDRYIICNDVIDLVNDSFNEENDHSDRTRILKSRSKPEIQTKKTIEKSKEKSSSKIGFCSICWDNLGNNPLVSTKCGHVFCRDCLEKSLKCSKRCPTCRCILKGSSAYHPLYLELG